MCIHCTYGTNCFKNLEYLGDVMDVWCCLVVLIFIIDVNQLLYNFGTKQVWKVILVLNYRYYLYSVGFVTISLCLYMLTMSDLNFILGTIYWPAPTKFTTTTDIVNLSIDAQP